MRKLKLLFLTLTALTSIQINSQCRPVFRRMMNQPPAAPKNYYTQESFSINNNLPFYISHISNDIKSMLDKEIKNYANIYFDLKSPMATNVNIVSVHAPSTDIRIIENSANYLNIYHNPGQSNIFLNNPDKEVIYIYNSLGALIEIVSSNDIETMVDVSSWPSGIYFL